MSQYYYCVIMLLCGWLADYLWMCNYTRNNFHGIRGVMINQVVTFYLIS